MTSRHVLEGGGVSQHLSSIGATALCIWVFGYSLWESITHVITYQCVEGQMSILPAVSSGPIRLQASLILV